MDTAGLNVSLPKPWLRTMAIGLYLLCLVMTAVFAYKRPHYNWDILPYMAMVIRQDEKGIEQVHRLTYQAARENIPAKAYDLMLEGEYRKHLAEDAAAFNSTLPFYAVKPLYIHTMSAFHKAGLSLPASSVLPSVIFYILTGLLIFYWLSKYFKLIWTFAVCLLMMNTGFMVSLARLSTPDCMSAFFLLSAIYFILEKPSLTWISFFLILALFTRLDNVIACFFILSFLFFSSKSTMKMKPRFYLSLLLVFTVSYFGIVAVTMKNFGWSIFYYPSFVLNMNLEHASHSVFSLRSYIDVAVAGVMRAIEYYHFIFFLVFFLLILYSPGLKMNSLTKDQSFSVLLMLIIVFRFLLYPDLSDRFNAAYYLTFLIIFIKNYSVIRSFAR